MIISDDNWNELSFYDISNTASPEFVCKYSWNLATDDFSIQDGYLYTANEYYGLNILDLNQIVGIDDYIQVPATSFNLRNYPNPFNPETTISFELSKAGNVVLDIYNIKGELLKRLINHQMSNGMHSVVWNGKDNNGHICSSGIYCCKISNNGIVETKKMLLLK